MPESKSRTHGKTVKRQAKAEQAERRAARRAAEQEPGPLPTWYKVIMFGLMIVGLLWIVVYRGARPDNRGKSAPYLFLAAATGRWLRRSPRPEKESAEPPR